MTGSALAGPVQQFGLEAWIKPGGLTLVGSLPSFAMGDAGGQNAPAIALPVDPGAASGRALGFAARFCTDSRAFLHGRTHPNRARADALSYAQAFPFRTSNRS